jgi:hypothetical protein
MGPKTLPTIWHTYILCSHPLLNMRMHAGDLMLALSILISGNNFQKISTLAKCLKLPFLSSSTFHCIQGTYLVPSIDRFWMQQQEDVLSEFQDANPCYNSQHILASMIYFFILYSHPLTLLFFEQQNHNSFSIFVEFSILSRARSKGYNLLISANSC